MSARILVLLLPLGFWACTWSADPMGPANSAQSTSTAAASQDSRVESILRTMKDHYVYPENAARASDDIRAVGTAFQALDDQEFADAMRKPLSDMVGDRHLLLFYSKDPVSEESFEEANAPDPVAETQMAAFGERVNYGISDVKILDGNIGYIAIDSFFPAEIASPAVAKAMGKLRQTKALIVDLRNSEYGGEPDMVALLCGYLIPGPGRLLTRTVYRSGEVQESRMPFVEADKRYPDDAPIYVLTSEKTFSAGEELAYNLKVFGRANIIGESTGGGANPGDSYRVSNHLTLFVPEAEVFSAVDGGNWNWTGVIPDERVDAADALDLALERIGGL